MPLGFVVEDDEDIARLFEMALHAVEFSVEVVHDGRQALDRLAAIVPDVVLLDLNLPAISGVEVLHQIRRDERLAATIVIVVTANPQMADEVTDLADLVLIKPISYDQLRSLIARFG